VVKRARSISAAPVTQLAPGTSAQAAVEPFIILDLVVEEKEEEDEIV